MVLRKLFSLDSTLNGRGPVLFAWQKEGTYLAVAGASRRVIIVDRQGKTVHQIALPGQTPPIAIEWDCNGEVLAVLQDKGSSVLLFNMHTKKQDNIDSGIKDLTVMAWSKVGPQLAVANAKGALLIYNKDSLKKIPIMGKHSKKITGIIWNNRNLLATIGEDKQLTISDAEGTTLDQIALKVEPTSVCFTDIKAEDRAGDVENTVALNMNGKTILLYHAQKKEPPIELTFPTKYGNIVSHKFYGDGYVLVGFSSGYVLIVSTHPSELGNEVSSYKVHRDALQDVTYCPSLRKGATVGDNCVRVLDMDDNQMSDQKSEKYELDNEFGALHRVQWTSDGQILTAASKNGNLYAFLTRIPVLSDARGTQVLYLSSLREVSIKEFQNDAEIARIPLDMEPAFVALGINTAAIGMNNQVSYYRFVPGQVGVQGVVQIGNRVYGAIVDKVCLNHEFAAVLLEGKIVLQPLDERSSKVQMTLPEKDTSKVTSMALTPNFLLFSTAAGNISVYSLVDQQLIVEYRHNVGVKSIFPSAQGTRVAFIDNAGNGHVLNPTTEVTTSIEGFASSTQKLLWDPADFGTIIGVDGNNFTTYVYSPNSRHGSTCEAVRSLELPDRPNLTSRPYGFNPVLVWRGNVTCQMPTGSLAIVPLMTHVNVYSNGRNDKTAFFNNLQLNRLNEAFGNATTPEDFEQLAQRALFVLNIDLAIRIYRQLARPTLVMCLEKIRHVQEKNLLLGHVSVICRQYNDAQNFFTRSSRPILALEMRRDMMQWDPALQLAERMAPDQVPIISKEYAQQLEFRAEYSAALEMFQRGHMEIPRTHLQNGDLATVQHEAIAHNEACQAGVARCMMRLGNIRGGMQIAGNSKNATLCMDCARILESMKQFEDAAALYERAEQYEKAATIYIKETKQLKKAAALLPKIQSRNIVAMYAKAKEATDSNYAEAEAAYAQAEDWDNVVRIKVEHLNDLNGAYKIVRRTKSVDAAAVVAKMCRKKGENGAAVEFLILARKTPEAFELAQSTNTMTNFEEALLQQVKLKDGIAPPSHRDDFALIAKYYDDKMKFDLAGDFYHVAGNFTMALTKFLQAGSEEYIEKAINVVGKARSDSLTHKLIDFLMGETDGEPKDPRYIFKLYMALNNYEKAAKTAVLIAVKEQELGDYRTAHSGLVDTCLVLNEKGVRIPNDLRRTLMLLHSYIIVKHLVKPLDDHDNATRMLLRVARNIQKFPKHIAAILTSCVLECIKADFKASAYEYSCILIQNEAHRNEINEKHRKKIEAIVRKRGKEELVDPPEAACPCVFCSASVRETDLECGACKNTLPFCIVTGKAMVRDDWSSCPNCKFPARFTPFLKLLRVQPQCPMCNAAVDPLRITKDPNPMSGDNGEMGSLF